MPSSEKPWGLSKCPQTDRWKGTAFVNLENEVLSKTLVLIKAFGPFRKILQVKVEVLILQPPGPCFGGIGEVWVLTHQRAPPS